MKKIVIALILISCITVSGCARSPWLYRVNVQQGNIITADMVKQMKIGMSKDAVCDLLGPPVLMDPFNDNRWAYVFTLKPGRGKCIDRRFTIYFRNDRVVKMYATNITS